MEEDPISSRAPNGARLSGQRGACWGLDWEATCSPQVVSDRCSRDPSRAGPGVLLPRMRGSHTENASHRHLVCIGVAQWRSASGLQASSSPQSPLWVLKSGRGEVTINIATTPSLLNFPTRGPAGMVVHTGPGLQPELGWPVCQLGPTAPFLSHFCCLQLSENRLSGENRVSFVPSVPAQLLLR